jgi:hypothetical protein
MKIRQVATELFHAHGWTDGKTDMTKLIVTFHGFFWRTQKRRAPYFELICVTEHHIFGVEEKSKFLRFSTLNSKYILLLLKLLLLLFWFETAILSQSLCNMCRSQWPRGLRYRSSAARLLRPCVRIPPRAWMFVVSVLCCQVEVSATIWSLVQRSSTDCGASLCVIKKHSKTRRLKLATGLWKIQTQWVVTPG